MTQEEFEYRKEFAKDLAERFTAEEIAMILWQQQCCVCAFQYGHNCKGDLDCALGIALQAKRDFEDVYDFTEHKAVREVTHE